MVGVDQARDDDTIRQADDFICILILLREQAGLPDPLNNVAFYVYCSIIDFAIELAECGQSSDVLQ